MSMKQIGVATSSIVGFLVIAGSVALLAGQESTPAADAANVWTYITETSSYETWDAWPGHEGFQPGNSPHGAFVKLYVNEPAMNALRSGNALPSGSIIVKENYGPNKQELMAVTPMYRVDGYNPDGGNWFWAKYGANGDVETSGRVESCIECHGAGEGDDFLFTEAE